MKTLLATLLLIAGCAHTPEPPPVDPPTPVEAEACDAFCELRSSLRCDDHEGATPGADEIIGTADDVACEVACRDFLAGSTYIANRECLNTAKTCEESEECVFEGGIAQ